MSGTCSSCGVYCCTCQGCILIDGLCPTCKAKKDANS